MQSTTNGRIGLAVLLFMAILLGLFGFSSTALAHDGVHIVQPGETLSEIAQRYSTDVDTLRRLNNLSDVDFVWAGQRLVLPEESVAAQDNPADSRVEKKAVADPNDTMVYVVQPGDTLSEIAVTFRTSLARLVEINRIYPGQWLVPGRELRVPTVVHRVQAGENLGTIAARYDTTPRAIARANDLANPSLITPGQELVIAPPSPAERAGMDVATGADGYHVHTEFPTTTEKWIDVDLSEQRVVAYEGTQPVRSFIVSTGLPGTPTVTGTFRIWAKTPLQDMYGGNRAAGDYYYLKDVPWVQYFYEDYSFHGTYWHNNFGQPMSRGCVNMTIEDAKWLFDWASPYMDRAGWLISDASNPGTLVMVHQ